MTDPREKAPGQPSRNNAPADQQREHTRDSKSQRQRRQDELLDESVEETFPASDPISPKQIT